MFLKDKLTKGALKLNTSVVYDKEEVPVKLPQNIHSAIQAFSSKSVLEFDGTDSIIEGTDKPMQFGTGDFTFSTWIYFPNTSTTAVIASKYKDASNYWNLTISWAANQPLIAFTTKIGGSGGAGGAVFHLGSAISAGTSGWYNIVLTADRSDSTDGMVVYFNGASPGGLIISDEGGTGDLDIDALYTIGYNPQSLGTRTGSGVKIAEQRWYDTVFTADEVIALYKESFTEGAEAAGKIANLKDYFTFGDRFDPMLGRESHRVERDALNLQGYKTTAKLQKAIGIHRVKEDAGTELVSNGTFDSDLSGWSVTGSEWTQSSGRAVSEEHSKHLTLTGKTTTIGNTYKISYDATQVEGSACYVKANIGSVEGLTDLTLPDTITETIRANDTGGAITMQSVRLSTNNTIGVDNVSIVEYPTKNMIPRNFASTAFQKVKLKGGKLV